MSENLEDCSYINNISDNMNLFKKTFLGQEVETIEIKWNNTQQPLDVNNNNVQNTNQNNIQQNTITTQQQQNETSNTQKRSMIKIIEIKDIQQINQRETSPPKDFGNEEEDPDDLIDTDNLDFKKFKKDIESFKKKLQGQNNQQQTNLNSKKKVIIKDITQAIQVLGIKFPYVSASQLVYALCYLTQEQCDQFFQNRMKDINDYPSDEILFPSYSQSLDALDNQSQILQETTIQIKQINYIINRSQADIKKYEQLFKENRNQLNTAYSMKHQLQQDMINKKIPYEQFQEYYKINTLKRKELIQEGKIYFFNYLTIKNGICKVDLHGFYSCEVEEIIQILIEEVQQYKKAPEQAQYQNIKLIIIVGKGIFYVVQGIHSRGGKAIIGPMVLQKLRNLFKKSFILNNGRIEFDI